MISMTYLKDIISTALQPRIALAALRLAAVVGIVLNLINQGGAIWGDLSFSSGHFILNFLVPFFVSSYSAAKNQLSLVQASGTGAEK